MNSHVTLRTLVCAVVAACALVAVPAANAALNINLLGTNVGVAADVGVLTGTQVVAADVAVTVTQTPQPTSAAPGSAPQPASA